MRTGAGRPFVLCHGGPGLWDELGPLASMVEDQATVLRWDQRGAGRSDHAGPYKIDRFVADLECIREQSGWESWIVGGHSWGAGLALRYALAHPGRTDALVCVSGTDLRWNEHRIAYRREQVARLGPHLRRWEDLVANELRTPAETHEMNLLSWSTDFGDRSAALELAKRWAYDRFEISLEANFGLGSEFARTDQDALAKACGDLDVPALVVHGEADPRPVDGPAELAGVLPRGRLARLPGVGHVPWAERPELCREALRGFLAELDGGS
ncbi:alpha/beta fold hydrolase [Flindersiella endophytica]